MDDSSKLILKLERQLRVWERKAEQLEHAPRCGTRTGANMVAQCMQELNDRLESVRIKLEKLRRAGAGRAGTARAELDQAFRALHTAWDVAVAKISWSDPLARE